MSERLAILGGAVVTPGGVIDPGTVLCEDGVITAVGRSAEISAEPGSAILDATEGMVFPGLIDTHVHGSGGDDLMSAGVEGIARIIRSQLKYGVTGFLPTTIAASHESLLRAISQTLEAERTARGAQVLGFHLEGPYINLKFKGAQPESGIREPDLDECHELLDASPGRVKIMTLAPEIPGGLDLIRWLTERGVTASLGHSEADYETALAAVEAGATHATHLYNAMSGLHHRRPGLAALCLNDPRITAELILDGVHVSPAMAKLAANAKRFERLLIITDAAAAQGCGDGIYSLGDSQIMVRGSLCTLMDGETIAGSVLTMNQAVSNALKFIGADLVEVAHMASLLPARFCDVGHLKGSIEVGKDADLAIFDRGFFARHTILRGKVVFSA